MIFKIVTLFLIFIAVLAMFGKLRTPKIVKKARERLSPAKCRRCGRHTFGKPCDCEGRS